MIIERKISVEEVLYFLYIFCVFSVIASCGWNLVTSVSQVVSTNLEFGRFRQPIFTM